MWLVGVTVCFGWIFSLCLHEFGHAIVAYWGGDTSVKNKGYLTFNPLRYTQPGYSLVLPLLFVIMGGIGLPGGAVYINRRKLRHLWWHSAVSAAGPAANILMVLLLGIPFWIYSATNSFDSFILEDNLLFSSLAFLIYLQVFAVIFNLLPIPPLDGYGIIEPWLPRSIQSKLDRFKQYSILVILGLFWFVPFFDRIIFKMIAKIIELLNIPFNLVATGAASFEHPINKAIAILILIILGLSLNSQETTWYHKGNNLIKKDRYQEALPFYERAITINSNYLEAWQQKARCLFYTQQYSRAIDCYQKILEIDPDNSFAWYNSACSYALLGDLDRAMIDLKKAIQLNPEELINTAKNDPDFTSLQEDERFKQLLEREN